VGKKEMETDPTHIFNFRATMQSQMVMASLEHWGAFGKVKVKK
jgi:hypothetical protein